MTQSRKSRPALRNSARRAVSLVLAVASSLPLTTSMVMASGGGGAWNQTTANVGHAPSSVGLHNNLAHTAAINTLAAPAAAGSSHRSFSNFFHTIRPQPLSALSPAAANGTLNLTSAQLQFLAGNLANFSQLTIDVGGKPMTVGLNTRLTGAEVIAVEQKLTSGTQGLQVAASGAASGGTIALNIGLITALDASLGGSINSLTIAHGVKVIDSLSSFTLDGSLTNYGKIVTTGSDTISAVDVVNSGMIHSVGNLFVDSNTLTNSGTISAQNNVSFSASNILNSGLLSATSGDVGFLSAGAISVNGTGGTISAAKGSIDFHDNSYVGSGSVTASGGNYLSQTVNFYAGSGDVNAALSNVRGIVNATAYNAHIGADTANLHLGTLNVANDPTYYNQGGNILIDGTVLATNGNPLAIVASGNIIAAGGSLDTSSTTAAGGDLTVVSGANFTVNGGSASSSNDSAATITITGASATGGYIDLAGVFQTTASPLTAVTTQSTTGQAGNITMVAWAGTGANSGSIVMPTASGAKQNVILNAQGATSAQNGNVTLIADGAGKSGAILVGDVVAGSVTVSGGTAGTLNGAGVSIKDGAITSGGFTAPTTYSNTFVQVGNVTASGNVTVNTVGQIVAGNLAAPSQVVTLNSTQSEIDTGNINVGGVGGAAGAGGSSGGTIAITASQGIFTNNLDATGGGGGGGSLNTDGSSQGGGNGGNGGSISLTAGSDNIQVGTVNVSGGGGGGGAGATALAAQGASGGAGGKGGAGGTIILSTNQAIITEGPLLAYAGGNGGTGGSFSTANSTGGAGGGGGGAFGGGGGGGAASGGGQFTTVSGGGGGGAGVYGGGGGGGANINTQATGGGGGSSSGPGGGGTGDAAGQGGINAPTIQEGGSGGNPDTTGVVSTAGGGVFGSAGSGGQSGVTGVGGGLVATAASGTNATTASMGGSVTLHFGADSYAGLPASKAPIEADAGTVAATGINNASLSLNLYGDSNELAGTSLGSNATLQVNTTTNLQLVYVGGGNLYLTESGNGTISGTGVQAVNLTLTGTTRAAAFDLRGSVYALVVSDPLGTVTFNNNSSANQPLVIGNANAATLTIDSGNGLVQAPKTSINAADVSLNIFGNVGTAAIPFLVNASNSLTLNGSQGSSFFLKDSSTAALTFVSGTVFEPLSVNLQTTASALSITNILATNVVINDTNTSGTILFNPTAGASAVVGDGLGTVSISSIGSIIGSSTTAAPGIQGTAINLVSKNGSVGGSNDTLANYITIDRNGGSTILTGSAKSGFLISYNGDISLGKISADTVAFVTHNGSGSELTLTAPLGTSTSTAVLLQADSSIQIASAADVISAKTVQLSLAAGGNIGSAAIPIQTKAGILNIFGSSSGTYVNGSGAFVNQTGSVTLGTVGAENVTINSTGIITTGATTVVGSSNIVFATQTLNLTAATGLTVGLGNVVEANTSNLYTGSGKVTVNGTVYDFDSTRLDVTKGSLQVLGAGTFTPGPSLTLAASGGVTIVSGDPIDKINPASGGLQSFTVLAGGVYASPYKSYMIGAANGTGTGTGNGGQISITAASLKFSTPLTGALSFTANPGSDDTGSGGSISLALTGTTSIALTGTAANVPTGALQVIATATGNANGGGGSISIAGGGNVFVDGTGFNASGQNGNGANFTFAAGKNLAVTADLTTIALATSTSGIAGRIALESNGTTPFIVGAPSGPITNGTQTAIVGGIIVIDAPSGININQSISSQPGTNYPGALLLTTSNLQINSAVVLEGNGQLNVTSATGITLAVGMQGSYTGVSIADLQANKGNITLGNFFNANGSEPSTNFATVSLVAPLGTVVFPSGQANLTVASSGTINVQAKAISFSTPNFAFIATGSALGGTIDISTVAPLSVGSAPGQISINARGAGGGSISLTSSGNLNVDFSAVTLSSRDVGLTLQGTNVLLANAAPVLTSFSLASLSITSNSTNAFVLGGATKNGIIDSTAGDTVVVGGQLTLVNNGGALSDQTSGSVVLNAGALTLYAKGDIDPLNFSTGTLNASSLGNVTLIEQPGQPLTVNNLTAGAAKTLSFTTAATSFVDIEGVVAAKTFNLTNDGILPLPVVTNASVINVNTTSQVNISDTLTAGVNLASLKATGDFALSSVGTITVSGVASSTGAISLTAGGQAGSVVISGKTAAITSTSTANNPGIVLAASGTGTLKSSGATNIATAGIVELVGGSKASTSLLRTNAGEFDLFGGVINVSNASTGAVNIFGNLPLVSLNYASTALSAGVLTVNSLNTTGGISIIANTSKLDVASGNVFAANGNILLQNNDLSGFINVEANAVISAVGTTTANGKVTISEGAVPSGLKQFVGSAANIQVLQVNGGKAFLGGKTSGATFTANASLSELSTVGSTITISAGATAGGVVINGSAFIYADVP